MTTPDDDFGQRMMMDADLALILAEYIWNSMHPFTLAGEQYEPVGGEDVPGYEDDDSAVLLRRKTDGRVFEVDIDVNVRAVLTDAQEEARRAELAGQLRLPGVTG